MELNLERIEQNVQNATTEDLLDRATVYRDEMEPPALELIDAELGERGITVADIETHLTGRQGIVTRDDGTVVKCSCCHRPAIREGWGWHFLFGVVPLIRRRMAWCEVHSRDQ